MDNNIIDIVHSCYIPNFRFINDVSIAFPRAEVQFNLDHRYYTPDYRGGLSAANSVILFSQSFLCFLYGIIKHQLSSKLVGMGLNPADRKIGDSVKMIKMDTVKFKGFVRSSDRLHANLYIKKIINRRISSNLIYFIVDFSVCGDKHVGTFHLALMV